MIRRMLLLSAAAVSLTVFAPSQSQAQSVFVLAGGAFPTGEFGDSFDTGWIVAGGAKLPLGPGGLWIGVEGSYAQHDTSIPGLTANPTGAMLIAGFDVPVPGGLSPYVFVGGGLLVPTGDLSDSGSKFGYEVGGGFKLGSGLISPFIEVRTHEFSRVQALRGGARPESRSLGGVS